MTIVLIKILLSLIVLVWSADKFVQGSAALAIHLGVSKFLIGVTIVALGTSAPEIFVSILAALNDSTTIAIGNVIGSNIANIGLVIGTSALFWPISLKQKIIKTELALMLAVSVLAMALLWNFYVSRLDSIVLLAIFILIGWFIIIRSVKEKVNYDVDEITTAKMSNKQAIFLIILGIILLPISSDILVESGSTLATYFGIDQFYIGLTLIAVGTSLPELITSIMSSYRNHHDIALGNIIGSNIYNLTAVLGIAGIIQPTAFSQYVVKRDLSFMLFISLLFAGLIYFTIRFHHKKLGRLSGIILLTSFIGYYAFLIFTAKV